MDFGHVTRLQDEECDYSDRSQAPATIGGLRVQLERTLTYLDSVAAQQGISSRAANDGTLLAPEVVKRIRQIQKFRRKREEVLGAQFFSDPAWDMLLELYLADLTQHRVPISSACIASCVPPTTALRWLAQLEANGLVSRENDPLDGRRSYLNLTPMAKQKLEELFS